MMHLAIWLGTLWGRAALGAGLVVALVAVRAWDISHQRAIGAERAIGQIEKATDNAIRLGRRAAERSRAAPAPAARGRVHDTAGRDPSTRDD